MTAYEPRGICIECGGARDPRDPSVRCPGCGRDASAVTWERTAGGRDPGVLGATLGGLALALGWLAFAWLRHTDGALWSVPFTLMTAAAAFAALLLAWWALRTPYGSWAFFTLDGARVGYAVWSDRALVYAGAHEGVGTPVSRASLAAPPGRPARSLDDGALVEALRGPLRLEDDEAEALRADGSSLAEAAAGLIARGAVRAYWQAGWTLAALRMAAPEPTRRLALELVDASLARGPSEAWVCGVLADEARRPPPDAPDVAANYRVAAAVSLPSVVAWDEVLDRWDDREGASDGVRVAPDVEARSALVAAAEADPALAAALLEVRRGG